MSAEAAPDTPLDALAEAAAVPRANGELVFAAPWEGRAFGLVVALHEQRQFRWDEFKDRLIAAIADTDHTDAPYYEHWLAAFERLLLDRGLLTPAELDVRTAALAADEDGH